MMNKFLLKTCDQLKFSEEEVIRNPNISIEACCYLLSNKNQEGYWTFKHLLEQIKFKAIPIFEVKFLNIIVVFIFDNNTNHVAYAKDTFVATRMNLDFKGK